jgi:hypothetical protein
VNQIALDIGASLPQDRFIPRKEGKKVDKLETLLEDIRAEYVRAEQHRAGSLL